MDVTAWDTSYSSRLPVTREIVMNNDRNKSDPIDRTMSDALVQTAHKPLNAAMLSVEQASACFISAERHANKWKGTQIKKPNPYVTVSAPN